MNGIFIRTMEVRADTPTNLNDPSGNQSLAMISMTPETVVSNSSAAAVASPPASTISSLLQDEIEKPAPTVKAEPGVSQYGQSNHRTRSTIDLTKDDDEPIKDTVYNECLSKKHRDAGCELFHTHMRPDGWKRVNGDLGCTFAYRARGVTKKTQVPNVNMFPGYAAIFDQWEKDGCTIDRILARPMEHAHAINLDALRQQTDAATYDAPVQHAHWSKSALEPPPKMSSSRRAGTMPTDDLRNKFKILKVRGGTNSETDRILLRVLEQEWGKGNPIPYKHLESVCSDPKNHIFVGKIGEEICTIFAYCHSGKDGNDATVVLVWTKRSHRRMGYCSVVMRAGIAHLWNDSRLMSGTSVSSSSRMLFESQNWSRIDKDMLTVEVRALKKTLDEKCNQKRPGKKKTSVKINGTSNKQNERNGTSGASTGKRKRSQDSAAAASTKGAYREAKNNDDAAMQHSINDQQDSTAAASTKSARREAKNNDTTAMQQRTVAATPSHIQRLELFSSLCRVLSNLGVQKLSIEQRLQRVERRYFGNTKEDLLAFQRFENLEKHFGVKKVASTLTERISVLEKILG
jgi:hypothetical protein